MIINICGLKACPCIDSVAKEFAEAGVIPKEREADVERIKKMLEE